MEDEKTIARINKDIKLFNEIIKQIENMELKNNELEVIKRAKSYFEDTNYYLKKGDLVTSFGCITYAHGLVDAIRLIYNLI